jgi:hypothetical protein
MDLKNKGSIMDVCKLPTTVDHPLNLVNNFNFIKITLTLNN